MSDRTDLWNNNLVQFSRLLCEINATQHIDWKLLEQEIDLTKIEIESIFDRANKEYQKAKEALFEYEL